MTNAETVPMVPIEFKSGPSYVRYILYELYALGFISGLRAIKMIKKQIQWQSQRLISFQGTAYIAQEETFKPGLRVVGRIASMCLQPCLKEYITALQVSIAKNS